MQDILLVCFLFKSEGEGKLHIIPPFNVHVCSFFYDNNTMSGIINITARLTTVILYIYTVRTKNILWKLKYNLLAHPSLYSINHKFQGWKISLCGAVTELYYQTDRWSGWCMGASKAVL